MFQKIAKHRANDASNDVHRPPLTGDASIYSVTPSQNRMLVTIFNDRYSNDDGTEVEHLPTISEDAKKIQDLLKTDFGYKVPSDDPTIFEPGKLENQPNLVKTFEVYLKKWKRKQPKGKTIDRFVLY